MERYPKKKTRTIKVGSVEIGGDAYFCAVNDKYSYN